MISVIIPVYNVEKYLKKCLDSVINQTYRDLEIILVNDGSTDRSRDICMQYAKADPRILLLEEENLGLSAARNLGIDRATGEYITFVDSDDFIADNMLEVLALNIKKYFADVSMCDFCKVSENQKVQSSFSKKEIIQEIDLDEFPNCINKHYSALVSAWGKLYRREIFREIRYPKGKLHEDEFILYDWVFQCKKIVYIKYSFYYYLQRDTGIMGNYGAQNVADIIEARSGHIDFAVKRNDESLYQIAQARMMCAMAVSYKRLKDAGKNEGLNEVYQRFCRLYQLKRLHKLLSLEERIGYFWLYRSPKFYIRMLGLYRRIRK